MSKRGKVEMIRGRDHGTPCEKKEHGYIEEGVEFKQVQSRSGNK